MLGKMVEVDWGSQITSYFAMIRIKIVVKDPAKIPKERLVAMRKKLYWLSFKVEGEIAQEQGDDPEEDKGPDDFEDENAERAADDSNRMDTDRRTPKQTKSNQPTSSMGEEHKKEGNKNSKTISMWASLLRDSYLVSLNMGEMSNFSGTNLLEQMDMVESEEEGETKNLEEGFVLPDEIVRELRKEKGSDGPLRAEELEQNGEDLGLPDQNLLLSEET